MYKKIKYLTTVTADGKDISYFFCKEKKYLFQMETSLLPTDVGIYDLLKKVFSLGFFKVSFIKIYMYLDTVYYCYLRVSSGKYFYDVNIESYVAVTILRMFNVHVYIYDHILDQVGFPVTRELLEKAMLSQERR